MIFIDYRSDRMRQIVEAFGVERHFETEKVAKDLVREFVNKFLQFHNLINSFRKFYKYLIINMHEIFFYFSGNSLHDTI